MLNTFRKSKRFRDYTIIVIVALLASYVLLGFGSTPPKAQGDSVATLGDIEIKLSDAWIQLENIKGSYRQLDKETVDRFTVNQLMSNAIMLNGANQLGMKVSDEELRDFVIQSRTSPDGNFLSNEDWTYRIKASYHVQVESFEEFLRQHSLRVEKFRGTFYDSAYVSETAIVDRFTDDNQKVKMELIALNTFDVRSEVKLDKDGAVQKLIDENPDEFRTGQLRQVKFIAVNSNVFKDSVTTNESEISEYYNANLERYMLKERVKASHILIKTEGRTDTEALDLAKKVGIEIDEGLDFAEAAKKYSEDDSNKDRGGDLGIFQRGSMVKPFERIAFAAANNDISLPVKTKFGYHIIKKFEHFHPSQSPLEDVKDAIVTSLKRAKTKEMALDVCGSFHALLSQGKTFEEAATEVNYPVQESPFFDEDRHSELGDVLRTNFQARKAVFELAALNDFSEPLSIGQEAVVMQWSAQKESKPLSLKDDKQRVKQLAQDIASSKFIKKALAGIKAAAEKDPDKTFKELAKNHKWIKANHIKTTSWVDGKSIPYEIRSDELDFLKDIYTLKVGQFLDTVETPVKTRLVLSRVLERKEVDLTKLDEERHALIATLRRDAGSDLLSAYMYSKRSQYDPKGEKEQALTDSLTR